MKCLAQALRSCLNQVWRLRRLSTQDETARDVATSAIMARRPYLDGKKAIPFSYDQYFSQQRLQADFIAMVIAFMLFPPLYGARVASSYCNGSPGDEPKRWAYLLGVEDCDGKAISQLFLRALLKLPQCHAGVVRSTLTSVNYIGAQVVIDYLLLYTVLLHRHWWLSKGRTCLIPAMQLAPVLWGLMPLCWGPTAPRHMSIVGAIGHKMPLIYWWNALAFQVQFKNSMPLFLACLGLWLVPYLEGAPLPSSVASWVVQLAGLFSPMILTYILDKSMQRGYNKRYATRDRAAGMVYDGCTKVSSRTPAGTVHQDGQTCSKPEGTKQTLRQRNLPQMPSTPSHTTAVPAPLTPPPQAADRSHTALQMLLSRGGPAAATTAAATATGRPRQTLQQLQAKSPQHATPMSVAAPAVSPLPSIHCFELARSLLPLPCDLVYTPASELTCVTLKIQDLEPEDLPHGWEQPFQELFAQHEAQLVTTYIRHGCVHLLLEVVAGDSSSSTGSAGSTGSSSSSSGGIISSMASTASSNTASIQAGSLPTSADLCQAISGPKQLVGTTSRVPGSSGMPGIRASVEAPTGRCCQSGHQPPELASAAPVLEPVHLQVLQPVCILAACGDVQLLVSVSSSGRIGSLVFFARCRGRFIASVAADVSSEKHTDFPTASHETVKADSLMLPPTVCHKVWLAVPTPHRAGLVMVECAQQEQLSEAWPLLVAPSAAVQQEVQGLLGQQGRIPPAAAKALIMDLGQFLDGVACWEEQAAADCAAPAMHPAPAAGTPGYSPKAGRSDTSQGRCFAGSTAHRGRMLRLGASLAAFACRAGWPATFEYVVSALQGTGVQLQQLDQLMCTTQGFSLLHCVGMSLSLDVLRSALSIPGIAALNWSQQGHRGLTPLHFLAARPAAAAAVSCLGQHLPSQAAHLHRLWHAAAAADGSTPAGFAEKAGCSEAVQRAWSTALAAQA